MYIAQIEHLKTDEAVAKEVPDGIGARRGFERRRSRARALPMELVCLYTRVVVVVVSDFSY